MGEKPLMAGYGITEKIYPQIVNRRTEPPYRID